MATYLGAPASLEPFVSLLTEARERTLLLIGGLSEHDLRVQHDPLMSPILWDLGHIAHFEELWLVNNLEGPMEFGEMPGMFNPFENPRATRAGLPLPSIDDCLETLADIRRRALSRVESLEPKADSLLLRDGYVYRMVAQHEYQHNETILQTLQLKQGELYCAPRSRLLPEGKVPAAEMVRFSGGDVIIGTTDRSAAYDNERPAHTVRLESFWIDTTPVTNGAYLEFMADGGYAKRELWSEEGWRWLTEAGVTAPKHWSRDGSEWTARVMDVERPIDHLLPVCHVCYHEAQAFARWAGKRLPTEFEWEAAASCDPASGEKYAYPWGNEPPTHDHANLDQLAFDAAQVGAFARGLSPIGCSGMIGDVWEWTSSDFRGYPGFETFPYREYSEVFFGAEYKVLRGGSWATRPGAIRNTFRNWDYPIRRQIFSGFRCVKDE